MKAYIDHPSFADPQPYCDFFAVPQPPLSHKDDQTFRFLAYNYARKHECDTPDPWAARVRWCCDDLVTANRWLAFHFARKMSARRNTGIDFDDLLSDCLLAVLRSVRGFDVTRGVKFGTYATNAMIRITRTLRAKERKHRTSRETFYYDGTIRKFAAKATDIRDDALWARVLEAVEKLPERERIVIAGQFLCPRKMSAESLAAPFRVTKQRVHQLKNLAIGRIRKSLGVET